jgi:capsule polysaccharide modification protein KpsS
MSLSRVKQDDMVRALVDQASDIPVVIKVHPFSRQKVPEHVDWIESLHDPRKGVFVVEDHIHRLIRNSSAVVCVNSGVGLEALLLGKPVITCGETDYHHLTFKAHAPGDLRGLIENARAPDQVTLCRYAKWLFGEQYIDVREDPAIWVDEVYSRLMRTGRRGRRS